MKIYIHRSGQEHPDAVEAPPETALGELLAEGDGAVTIAQLEDDDTPLELTATVQSTGLQDRAHLFAGARQRIAVEVVYNDETHEHEFSASTTVRRAFQWAVGEHAFDLSPEDAVEHTLALCSTGVVPAEDVHLGSLDAETPGQVCFMLIPKHRFEG
jgi:hypothetical protein